MIEPCLASALLAGVTSIFDSEAFSSALFFPHDLLKPPPPQANDLWIEVAPRVRLHGRRYRHEGSKALVLLFHGNGEVVSVYDAFAPMFARVFLDLLVVTYRGYGTSGGTPSLRACLRDAHRWLEAASKEASGVPLLVMGRSLGGNCAAELCQEQRAGVAGYIFESAPSDLDALVRRRDIEHPYKITEEDRGDFCPLRKMARCQTPTLVLHGAEDRLIHPSEAKATFNALSAQRKWLTFVPDRGHNDLSYSPVYWEALRDLVRALDL